MEVMNMDIEWNQFVSDHDIDNPWRTLIWSFVVVYLFYVLFWVFAPQMKPRETDFAHSIEYYVWHV